MSFPGFYHKLFWCKLVQLSDEVDLTVGDDVKLSLDAEIKTTDNFNNLISNLFTAIHEFKNANTQYQLSDFYHIPYSEITLNFKIGDMSIQILIVSLIE